MQKIKQIVSQIKSFKFNKEIIITIKNCIFHVNFPKELKPYIKKPYLIIATFGYTGFFTKAPGTFASLLTLIIAILLYRVSEYLLLTFAIVSLVAGYWSVKKMVALHKVQDPSYIVIDEVIGMLVPLLIAGGSIYLGIISFLLFRFFDITKISFVKTVEEYSEGELGIIGDDIIAGCFSLFTLVLLLLFF